MVELNKILVATTSGLSGFGEKIKAEQPALSLKERKEGKASRSKNHCYL